jgi:hypothetical protein
MAMYLNPSLEAAARVRVPVKIIGGSEFKGIPERYGVLGPAHTLRLTNLPYFADTDTREKFTGGLPVVFDGYFVICINGRLLDERQVHLTFLHELRHVLDHEVVRYNQVYEVWIRDTLLGNHPLNEQATDAWARRELNRLEEHVGKSFPQEISPLAYWARVRDAMGRV